MTRLHAPRDLPTLVRNTFAAAVAKKEVNYYPTQVAILQANSIPIQLRFSPSLANKPKGPPPDPNRKPFDPFADPPPALKITDLSASHYLVLNKFAVVPEHFILATTPFKQQTHILEPDDLDATRACIEAYAAAAATAAGEDGGEDDGLFAFFNCGEHSGASQPHRHIQLLPIARMKDGLGPDDAQWNVLARHLGDESTVPPFRTFTERIEMSMTADQLWEIYLRLYREACRAVAEHAGEDPTLEIPAEGETRISYNMAMTTTTLTICPRLTEGESLKDREGTTVGKLALNGTVLAGTALVKTEAEWDALRKDPNALVKILQAIGLPNAPSSNL